MKYSLAIDRGEGYPIEERYEVLPLSSIDSRLDVLDNFQILCNFTMQFLNEVELKKIIFKKLPEFIFLRNGTLVILKGKRLLGETIPYLPMKKYFDFTTLENTILNHLKDPIFRTSFLSHFSRIRYFQTVSNNLRSACDRGSSISYLQSAVHQFLLRVCGGENGLDYRQLYKVIFLVQSTLDLLYQDPSVTESVEQDDFDLARESEETDSPIEFEAEWLAHRARLRELGKW